MKSASSAVFRPFRGVRLNFQHFFEGGARKPPHQPSPDHDPQSKGRIPNPTKSGIETSVRGK